MVPLALAKCWSLDDGTTCTLWKVTDQAWELRVLRGAESRQVVTLTDVRLLVRAADTLRAQYASAAKIA